MQKGSTAALPKPKKTVPERKTHRKSCSEAAQKTPSAQHGRAKLREASKTQQNVITERRAPRKHKKGVKQRHERKPLTTPNADVPLVILPTRVRSKFAKQKKQDLFHGNIDASTMFKSMRIGANRTKICARSSPPNGGPSSKFYYRCYVLGGTSLNYLGNRCPIPGEPRPR